MRQFAALLSVSLAFAAFLTPDQAAAEIQTFRPSADTFADQAQPNKAFASARRLDVRDGSKPAKQVYVRFPVAGLGGPVSEATLRFYVANGTPNGPAVFRTEEWPSNPLTWARRPAAVSGPRDDKGSLAGGSWVEWDVTPWVTGDGSYRLALKGGVADTAGFTSSETTKQPQLVVTTLDPPPSTLEYVAPAEGATVSGVTSVRVQAPAGTDWLGVYACGGLSVGEDHLQDANGEWSVQWDTQMAGCSNGLTDLDTFAFDGDLELGHASITVDVGNSSPPPPDPAPTPCEPTAAPNPVAGLGYSLRFSDCFETLNPSVWCSNQWWEPRPPLGTQYVDENDVLHLVRRRVDGYPNVTVSTEPCGQANPQSFQYGYMEARMRYETVRGNGPAFWLLSTRHATNPDFDNPEPYDPNPYCRQNGLPLAECWASELDVFEGFGRIDVGDPSGPVNDFFSGAVHRNSAGFYGQTDQFRFIQRRTGLDLSTWHVYAALWTGSTVSYYIDGDLQGSVNTFDSTRQPMHLLFYNWNTEWEDENMPTASTPDRLDVSVDWVRVWQQ